MPYPKEVSTIPEKAQKLLDPEKNFNKTDLNYENDNFKSVNEKSNLKVNK